MELKNLILILCSLALLREIGAIGTMGPLGHIIIESVYECYGADKPTGDDVNLQAKLVMNDEGDTAVNVIIENKVAIDDTMNHILELEKFENGNWRKFYNVKGKPCQDLNRYLKKIWGKFSAAFVPTLSNSCPIPPGIYKLDKFQAETKDFDIKSIFYGKLRIKVSVSDKDGKTLFCFYGAGSSQSLL